MTTKLQWSKGGLRLVLTTSKRARPRLRQAFPIPDFPDASTSLLSLALEIVLQTGRKGIRVISTPTTLPGGSEAVWKLFHAAYQGTAPSPLSYEEIPVQAPKVNLLIDPALPKATHKFYLQREEGGKTYKYTEATIATPDDLLAPLSLEGILADDMISSTEKAAFKAYYDAVIAEQAGYVAQANQWLVSHTTYDSAITALTAAVTALSPVYTDLTSSSPVAGATMLALFRAVYDARSALIAAISTAQGNGAGDPFADDKLTPAEKYTVKGWYDDLIGEQAGLDTAASTAGITTEKTAYDNAITALISAMDGLTGTDGWNPATHDWRNYTATYSLGSGGGATLRGKYTTVYSTRSALRNAILLAGVQPNSATETFRPLFRWNFGEDGNAGWTISSATTTNPVAPDDRTAKRYTATAANGPKLAITLPRTVPGTQAYIVQARVRLISGAWDGVLKYSNASHAVSGSFYQKITAPVVGAWQIVTWDMRALFIGGTEYVDGSGGDVSGYQFELGTAAGTAVVEVDWIAAGIYGAGSQADYDDARNALIADLMSRADTTIFSNVVISNSANLMPNPQSEQVVGTGATDLRANDIGAVALSNPDTGNSYSGNGCRKVTGNGGTVTSTVTLKQRAVAGESFYLAVRGKRTTSGTARVRVQAYDISNSSLGTILTLDFTTSSYVQATGMATTPASTAYFLVHIEAVSVPGGSFAYFDDFNLRRAVESFLVVDGAIVARHFSAAAGEAGIFRVGPWYRFYTNDLSSGGTVLAFQADGGFSRPASGEVANANDATYYGDPTRTYPALNPTRYEMSAWNGTGNRSIVFGLGSPWASSGLTGFELRRDPVNNRFGLFSVTGIGTYTQIGGWITLASPGTAVEKISLKVYNQASPASGDGRILVYFDKVLKKTWTHNDLGYTAGVANPISGYAGIRLADTTVRAGFFAFGPGNVMIDGGIVTADMLEADIFKTTDYAEDGSGNPTAGAKMYVNSTAGGVGIKVGPNGLQVGTAILNQASLRRNRIENGNFANSIFADYEGTTYIRPYPWSGAPTDFGLDSHTYADGTGAAYASSMTMSMSIVGAGTLTKGGASHQSFTIPIVPPSSVHQAHLKWSMGLVAQDANITAASFRLKTWLYAPDGTSYLIDDSTISTYDLSSGSPVTWTNKDYNIDTQLQAKGAGQWVILFDASTFGNGLSGTNSGGTKWVAAQIGKVSLEI